MTPQQCDLVVETFALVLKHRADFGRVFYRNLFLIAPDLRPMFGTDIELQAKKLVDLLATGVASLGDPSRLLPTLEDLGARHATYGVQPEHYLYVGAALMATLEESLGSAFGREVREAWNVLYGLVSRAMKKGAAREGAGRTRIADVGGRPERHSVPVG